MVQFRDPEPEYYPLTLALTGTRYGEATALRWSDIDEVGGAIRIERAQWHGIVGETKTGNVRTVPLTAELAEVFRDRRQTARGSVGWGVRERRRWAAWPLRTPVPASAGTGARRDYQAGQRPGAAAHLQQ